MPTSDTQPTAGDPAGSRGPAGGGGRPAEPAAGLRSAVVTRRAFVGGTVGSLSLAYAAYMGGTPLRHLVSQPLEDDELAAVVQPPPDILIHAERDDDMVQLDFAFYGYAVDATLTPPAIVPLPTNPTFARLYRVVVQFPPQSIGEAVYPLEQGVPFATDPPPVVSAVAPPSRVAFNLGPTATIPLPTMTVADLLAWDGWPIAVVPPADARNIGTAKPVNPAAYPYQTSIAAPYGLFISPVIEEYYIPFRILTRTAVRNAVILPGFRVSPHFTARTQPLVNAGVTDCWSTHLAGHGGASITAPPQVSAFWAADYPYLSVPNATAEDRIQY